MNIEKLGTLLASDTNAKLLLSTLVKGNHKESTTVEKAGQIFSVHGINLERNQIVYLFKQFQRAECGRFITGRRGRSSRMHWIPEAAALLKAASDPQVPPASSSPLGAAGKNVVKLVHQFHLRPDCTVSFELPIDLSGNEAARIARFIESLPMGLGPQLTNENLAA
jgi:hypothetical protein